MADAPCPRCSVALVPRAANVLGCTTCGGVFVEERLADLLAAIARAPDAPADPAPRTLSAEATRAVAPCPVCAEPMRKQRAGLALEVDTCSHGTWFDAGERARLKAALARGLSVVEVGTAARGPARPPGAREDLPASLDVSALPRVEVIGSPTQDAHDAERAARVMLAHAKVEDLAFEARMKEQLRRARGRRRRRGGAFLTPGIDEAVRWFFFGD